MSRYGTQVGQAQRGISGSGRAHHEHESDPLVRAAVPFGAWSKVFRCWVLTSLDYIEKSLPHDELRFSPPQASAPPRGEPDSRFPPGALHLGMGVADRMGLQPTARAQGQRPPPGGLPERSAGAHGNLHVQLTPSEVSRWSLGGFTNNYIE